MRLNRNSIIPWGCVYKITFPNNKIYVGSDTAKTARLDFFKYFGTPVRAKVQMLGELGEYLNPDNPYMVKKENLYAQENVTVGEVFRIEQEFIRALDAKNPAVGYNR